MSIRDSAHPELPAPAKAGVEGPDFPEPGMPRILPDFLKQGDPALTFPHGKTYGVNHPKGVPNLPGPITRDELARDWLGHIAAGRIGGSNA